MEQGTNSICYKSIIDYEAAALSRQKIWEPEPKKKKKVAVEMGRRGSIWK